MAKTTSTASIPAPEKVSISKPPKGFPKTMPMLTAKHCIKDLLDGEKKHTHCLVGWIGATFKSRLVTTDGTSPAVKFSVALLERIKLKISKKAKTDNPGAMDQLIVWNDHKNTKPSDVARVWNQTVKSFGYGVAMKAKKAALKAA